MLLIFKYYLQIIALLRLYYNVLVLQNSHPTVNSCNITRSIVVLQRKLAMFKLQKYNCMYYTASN